MSDQVKKEGNNKSNKALTIVGIVLCALLIPILIMNCILIIKSYTNKDEVPGIGGLKPMIVLTDSMEPYIDAGDIIVAKEIATEDIQPGMVITFFDPASKTGTTVVTHRVMYIIDDGDGTVSFKTAGDYNVEKSGGNAENENGYDKLPVPAEKVIGVYSGFRIPNAGHIAMFMQTTPGLLLCIFVPLLAIVGFDIIRRRKNDKSKEKDVAGLMAELEALKAEKAKAEAEAAKKAEEAPAEPAPADEPSASDENQ